MRVHILHDSFKLSRPGGRWEISRAEVAIIGLGLIGGSIGLGLQDFSYAVGGWDIDPSAIDLALQRGAINGRFDSPEEAAEADLIVVATPPEAVVPTLERLAPHLRPETVITDCASVKAEIVGGVRRIAPPILPQFVGGHPMAGLHLSGIGNATWNLFEGAAWVLTPTAETDRQAYSTVSKMVHGLGAKVYLMDPAEHDRHVALLSHVPHLVAAQLMKEAIGLSYPQVSGGSWRDMTRVASSDPGLWTEIVMNNREAIAGVLRRLSTEMDQIATMVEEGDAFNVRRLFEDGREAKRRMGRES
jgi:prephenate dehydrogenase